MDTTPILSAVLGAANNANSAPDDYICPDDGLLYCGKCRTPKEAYFDEAHRFEGFLKHPTECRCAAEKRKAEEARRSELRRLEYIQQLRMEAFRDVPAAAWRFDGDLMWSESLKKAKRYADHWEEMHSAGLGLLLFGNVGTGKSYAAGCIANALIDRQVSVLFAPTSDVVNRMQGCFGDDRESYLKMLMRPDLLILDDLGAERDTSFGKERIFDVVNRRTLSRKPIIVTTNIPLSVMQNTTNLDDRRIYDRILEVCAPVVFAGDSYRKRNASKNIKKASAILSGAEE